MGGWVLCAQCLALGSIGLCHPTSDIFSICNLWNYRMYKVKENLSPFHKRAFVIPVAPFFSSIPGDPPCNSHQLFCFSQHQQPSQLVIDRDSVVRLQSGLAHSTHLLTLIQRLSCPWRQVEWGELVMPWAVWGSGSTAGQAADCPGNRDSIPSVGTAHLARGCQRAQGCRAARATEKASAAKAGNKR